MIPKEAPRPIGTTDHQPVATTKDTIATSKQAIKNDIPPANLM